MPAFISLPRSVRVAGVIGLLQTVGLAAYAISIIAFEFTDSTSGVQGSDLAPGVLVLLYFVFAALIGFVTYAFVTGHAAARTPFLLIQAFGIVIAEPLFAGDGTTGIAVAIVALSVVAAVASVLPSSRGVIR